MRWRHISPPEHHQPVYFDLSDTIDVSGSGTAAGRMGVTTVVVAGWYKHITRRGENGIAGDVGGEGSQGGDGGGKVEGGGLVRGKTRQVNEDDRFL